jgi:hypothetical protein
MTERPVVDGQLEVGPSKFCVTDITTAMLDFGLVVYGQCTSTIEDYEDPRIEPSCGAKLIATWEHMGLGEDYQRAQLGEHYDGAKADLAQYRHLKALCARAEMRVRASGETGLSDVRAAALRILASELADGGKIAALAMLLAGARTASEIARLTNRSLRTVERHYARARIRGNEHYATMRTEASGAGNLDDAGMRVSAA